MFSKFINLEFVQYKVNPLILQVALSDKILYAYAFGPENTKVVIRSSSDEISFVNCPRKTFRNLFVKVTEYY